MMKTTKKVLAIHFLLLISCLVQADISDYKDSFLEFPESGRPHTWWHWMNGNVTKEGITADLEAMAAVGIGGAQIFNVGDRGSVNIPVGPVDYMSDQWLELVKHAVQEARRLGIEICMHNCAGWSSSGGPWITPEHAMKKVTFGETEIQGPQPVSVQLPVPPTVRGYYRDIAVIAFPTPANKDYRIPNIGVKAGFQSAYGVDLDASAAPGDAVIASDSVLDLSDRMDTDGLLTWTCPAGSWTVLRIGYTITGKNNHPAPDSGLGLECDKLSRAAMDVHWNKGIQPILDRLGDLAGPVMNNLLIDSYEVGLNNWTEGFENEFKARRGYCLTKYLPTLSGRVVDGTGVSERFLWDYRRTLSDLFTANYFNYFAEKCHNAGLLCSTEPYDGPFECMSIASQSDILMGEFWVGGGVNPSVRIASSVAHVYGRKIVGAESFTSSPERGRWQNHPRSMKALGDEIWCNGINRYIFHRYAHQPWTNQWPGMTMGQWGTHFERTNTWWEDGRSWMQYIARSQYLLQAGRFHADLLFFAGEFVPNGAVYRPDVKEKGYDYDAIGTDLIGALSVEDGMLVLPGGMRYALLVMPETQTMSLPVARKIEQLIRDGAVVLAARPRQTPSLVGYPESEHELQRIAQRLWSETDRRKTDRRIGAGRLMSGYSYDQALARMGLKPNFEVLEAGHRMNFIHRVIDGADVYLVSNQQDKAIQVRCGFRVTGKQPQLWDAQRGTVAPATLWQPDNDRTIVTLALEPEASVFVVFDEPVVEERPTYVSIERSGDEPVHTLQPEMPRLEIVKAEYGVFDLAQSRMADVTDRLNALIENGRLTVSAGNHLAGDPAPNTVKKMLVEYTYDGNTHAVRVDENQTLRLPQEGTAVGKELIIHRAVYGDLPDVLVKMPELRTVDITDRLSAKVSDDVLRVRITNALAGGDPVVNVPKQIKVTYRLNDSEYTIVKHENEMLEIPSDPWKAAPWPAELHRDGKAVKLRVWDPGIYRLEKSDGGKAVVTVSTMSEPMELAGPWSVRFESRVSTPKPLVMQRLASLTDSSDLDVKGFSGTAIYQNTLNVTDDMLKPGRQVLLDLGRVEVMARVFVNGRDFGVLWKNPYRVDISEALRPGENQLEIRVTNLWVNRIIADEAYEPDCQWQGVVLEKWPDWLTEGRPRPTRRQTFYTWKHWDKHDPLLPSGLIGPVYIRAAHDYAVSPESAK